MKNIPVGKGQVALVDDDDYEWITHWRWHLNQDGYAIRKVYINGRKEGSYSVFMHRMLIGTPANMHTDHINGVPLDNRKTNLRVCKMMDNFKNRKVYKSNTSGYKGVHLHTRLKRWVARISVDGKRIHLGLFDDPKDAAAAYNLAAIKYHGKFARLNIINEN
jgi:hypothetical protein